MKNIAIPYLRSFLLLTLLVGLMGVAKILLLKNVANVEASLVNYSQVSSVDQESSTGQKSSTDLESSTDKKSSPGFYVWSTNGTLAKPSSWNFDSVEDEADEAAVTQDIFNSTVASLKVESTEEVFTDKVMESLKAEFEKAVNEESVKEKIEERVAASAKVSPNKITSSFQDHLALQAELRLQSNVTYDGRYLKIGYPMGDVPENIGVCTDVVIRSFRGLGIDLQQRVHEDMKRNFHRYPNNWQLSKPDTNIDHRRVPNLMTYFKRVGASLKVTRNPSDYKVGNIVTWDLGHGLTHIGIVSNSVSAITGNPLIVHNIGDGPELNDMLFKHKITGHYNYGSALSSSRMKSFAKNNDYLGETGS